MASDRYDDLRKLEEQRKEALAKEAQKKSMKEERPGPQSSARFQTVRQSHEIVDARMRTEKDFSANHRPMTRAASSDPTHTSVPAQVFIASDNPRSFSPDQPRARSGQADFHPAPGGSGFQAGSPQGPGAAAHRAAAAQRAEQQRAQSDPFGRPREPGQKQPQPARAQDVWSKTRGETGDRAQGRMNREATRETTDRRQANPFAREASDKAQRLVNAISTQSKDRSRGRD